MVDDLTRLRTARLLLTRIEKADFAELCRMHRDPEVMATLGGIRSDEVSADILEQLMAHWEAHGFGYWMAHDPETGAFVGRGGLRRVVVGGGDEIEVGYALMPQYWGRGLATELARECARIGFEQLGQRDLVAFTLPTNYASRSVMQRVGFLYERDVIWAGMPHVLYRLPIEVWRGEAG
ncbi:MAG TPA: GNAT family N-acetyltransferase [Candidatus Dormibacteraeota bacterium]|nr:GNAT family N-acetyltransferase [Candidatus Dormibacteraeota bacterium]